MDAIFFNSAYCLLIFFFCIGLLKSIQTKNSHKHKISVIIAARNEEQNLPHLLEILFDQSYPDELYEVVVADDRSQDGTSAVVKKFQKSHSNLKLVKIEKENPDLVGKKGALTAAISVSSNEILAFTDADSLPTRFWLEEINAHFTPETDFIAGYTFIKMKNRFWELLKNLERSALFAVIAGAFGWKWGLTCGAANMAYRRELFDSVNGFEGIGHIRSGDDDLMLHKMAKKIRRMRFMFSQNSIVDSQGTKNAREQVQQETRRASKWKYYPLSIKLLTFFVFVYYLVFITALAAAIINHLGLSSFLLFLAMKVISEFLLVFTFLIKIKKIHLMSVFPLAELIYIPYYIFFGLKGTFGRYRWKD